MLRRAAAGTAAALAAVLTTGAVAAPARADAVRDRQQPILEVLQAAQAWKLTRGKGVTVAVVDSGVAAGQADLAGKVTTGPNMLAAVDAGAHVVREHGTGMATIIAGRGHGAGRRAGVIGLAPESRILGIRAIAEPEDGSYPRYRTSEKAEGAVGRGIRYAADHGADVINLSLGNYEGSDAEREAIGYAVGKGVVVVSAVGNDGDEQGKLDGDGFAPYSYPASFPGVIAVAATDDAHGRAKFSNRNYAAVLSAPGTDIPIGGPDGKYYLSAGTSDASAVVSGVAALIRSRHPKMAPALVAQALIGGSRNNDGAYDVDTGFGEVSAYRALAAADRLAAVRAPAAKKDDERFGPARPGPVEVVQRPAWVRPLLALVVGGAVAGAGGALLIARLLARRNPRRPAA
ncbi:S8 family serine peptidase [Actinomadura parmotrematis]|uniref:S8 family serine peptidase n=1 Tax=Actinomadura parmotrematis TaxID=2864039 RepID=A0ABS7FLP0_9ACTN|nr:S8 family serine peptidase [Actinomadura parmotrematis]MBW8481291.1 S8 family serine peptidase [Actinomadura parmotrematis]